LAISALAGAAAAPPVYFKRMQGRLHYSNRGRVRKRVKGGIELHSNDGTKNVSTVIKAAESDVDDAGKKSFRRFCEIVNKFALSFGK
jgi:hypothetical protein